MAAGHRRGPDRGRGVGATPRTFYELGSEPEHRTARRPSPSSPTWSSSPAASPITTGDPAVFEIPVEALVEADPEVIVSATPHYGVCPADVMARPGLVGHHGGRGGRRPARRRHRRSPGPDRGSREGLASLARAIHPDIELADAPAEFAGCAAAWPIRWPAPGHEHARRRARRSSRRDRLGAAAVRRRPVAARRSRASCVLRVAIVAGIALGTCRVLAGRHDRDPRASAARLAGRGRPGRRRPRRSSWSCGCRAC